MAKPYSMDLRERVVRAVAAEGMSCHGAAARFGVAPSSAIKWVRRFRDTGSATPRMGGRRSNILSGTTRDWLLERVTHDFTLRGLVAELGSRGIKVDYVQVWRFAHAEGLSFKKSVLPAEQLRPAVDRRCAQWKKYQGRLDPARLVFTDYVEQCLAPRCHPAMSSSWTTSPATRNPPSNAIRRRCQAALPAALQPRPEPDRAGVRQAQTPHAKAAERSHEHSWRRVGTLLNAFSSDECRNYLVNAGYAST